MMIYVFSEYLLPLTITHLLLQSFNYEDMFFSFFLKQKVDKEKFSKYKLYGVIVHIGGMASGHYYAYVKNLRTDEWELRDDSYVKKVNLESVFDRDAYILFYNKSEKVTELP